MTNPENEYLRESYKVKKIAEPPHPWRRVQCDISGVTAVGFGAGTELLLVLSHSGLGVFDCMSGKVVARLVDIEGKVSDPYPIKANGIGPLEGNDITLAGLWGGGLRTNTPDDWVVHRIAPEWPTESIILCPPENPELYDDPESAVMLIKNLDPGIRAMGFSDSGQALVVANTDLFVWTR